MLVLAKFYGSFFEIRNDIQQSYLLLALFLANPHKTSQKTSHKLTTSGHGHRHPFGLPAIFRTVSPHPLSLIPFRDSFPASGSCFVKKAEWLHGMREDDVNFYGF